jgi:cobalamin biosynthesis Mg chelatase CobN
LVFSASAGCAGNIDQVRHGRAAGEWQVHLPESRSAVGDLALGRGGNSEPAKSWFDEAPDDLFTPQPQPLVADARKKKPRSTQQRKTEAPAATPVRHIEPAAPEAQPKLNAPKSLAPVEYAMADTNAHDRYAAREETSQQQQQFKGGNVIIIGISTLVVILLVVVLILLLL